MLEALTGKGGRLLVSPWVPQLAVLAHPATKLFVTHCGINSLNEGLAAGKPLLGMPFATDQPGAVRTSRTWDHGGSECVAKGAKWLYPRRCVQAAAAVPPRRMARSDSPCYLCLPLAQ